MLQPMTIGQNIQVAVWSLLVLIKVGRYLMVCRVNDSRVQRCDCLVLVTLCGGKRAWTCAAEDGDGCLRGLVGCRGLLTAFTKTICNANMGDNLLIPCLISNYPSH